MRPRPNPGLIAAALVVGALFCGTIGRLMMVRLGAGNDFEAYSTLRSDPLGAKALYTAFRQQPNIEVQRFYRRVRDLDGLTEDAVGAGKTVFFLGATDSPDPREDIDTLNRFLMSGGRVVVAFFASTEHEGERPQDEEKTDERKEVPGKHESEEDAPWSADLVNVAEIWEFKVAYAPRPETSVGRGFIGFEARNEDYAGLPPVVPWHSSMYFTGMAEDWRTVYGWRNEAGDLRSVVVERPWGAGSVVLCSDTYLLSNEALLNDRRPEVLSWLAGPSTMLIFDEAHLGTFWRSNTMELMRKYRLHGVILTLLGVAVLFVWRNATSLVPRRQVVTPELRARAEHGEPLANLLRRHIAPGKLVRACVEEWRKDFGTDLDAAAAERIDDLARPATAQIDTQVALTYATICRVLAERKTNRVRTD